MSTENVTVRFGKRLRKLRKEKGWTQVQMADTLGIDRSYISDMERGKKERLFADTRGNGNRIRNHSVETTFAALIFA